MNAGDDKQWLDYESVMAGLSVAGSLGIALWTKAASCSRRSASAIHANDEKRTKKNEEVCWVALY
jgi:tRNA A37 N6-isopentenylltransferase MiaA